MGLGALVLHGVLAAVFGSAGAMKLSLPVEAQGFPVAMTPWMVAALGLAEIAGACGLVWPMFRPGEHLVARFAGAALLLIVVAAAVTTALYQELARALFPAVVAFGCAAVASGRTLTTTPSE